jgi:Flp pilus assembly protein TadD
VALHSAGKRSEALAVLYDADRRHPYNMDILHALISIHREAGDFNNALVYYARKLSEILPEDGNMKLLLEQLEAGR